QLGEVVAGFQVARLQRLQQQLELLDARARLGLGGGLAGRRGAVEALAGRLELLLGLAALLVQLEQQLLGVGLGLDTGFLQMVEQAARQLLKQVKGGLHGGFLGGHDALLAMMAHSSPTFRGGTGDGTGIARALDRKQGKPCQRPTARCRCALCSTSIRQSSNSKRSQSNWPSWRSSSPSAGSLAQRPAGQRSLKATSSAVMAPMRACTWPATSRPRWLSNSCASMSNCSWTPKCQAEA